ncbi:MAG: hypothetical protein Q8N42_01365 [bacterium]|nr:hypothetical protein [bacterium]
MEEEKIDNDALLNEWAEKIYRTSEKIYRELLRLRFLMDKPEEKEKFRELMHEKQFGKFIFTFKSKSQLGLYLRIGGHEMATDYCPSHYHIEKIKKFLAEQKENWLEVTQQIIMNLGVIPIVARLIRRNILYPEFEEMEKKIAELKKETEEIIGQLEITLGMWTYLGHDIESAIRQGTPLFYATRNKLAIWRNKFKK